MVFHISNKARTMISQIQSELKQDLIIVVGSGCCDGPLPQLILASEDIPTSRVTVYEEQGLVIYFQEPIKPLKNCTYTLNLDEDVINDSFSLESKYDCQFYMRIN